MNFLDPAIFFAGHRSVRQQGKAMPGTSNSGGRNTRSRQLHVLTGTFRDDRHAGGEAPAPPAGRPEAPTSLTAVARAEWDRMVDRLATSGTLAVVDDAALYQYVQLFAETERITERSVENTQLAKRLMRAVGKLNGEALVDAVQAIVALRALENKSTRDLRQGHMALRGYLVEFGMTPAARSRVKVPAGKPKSKVDAYRSAKGA
jgi:P27 family predicted phage terminase small subunit